MGIASAEVRQRAIAAYESGGPFPSALQPRLEPVVAEKSSLLVLKDLLWRRYGLNSSISVSIFYAFPFDPKRYFDFKSLSVPLSLTLDIWCMRTAATGKMNVWLARSADKAKHVADR